MIDKLQIQKEFIYINDVLSAMRHREEETYRIRDYLNDLNHYGKIPRVEDIIESKICRLKMAG